MSLSEVRTHTNWCEIDVTQLSRNVRYFKDLVGPDCILAIPVKANGYGHDMVIASKAFLSGGADWLCVHSIQEAQMLRHSGIVAPIHLVGPVPVSVISKVSVLNLSMVVYTHETVDALIEAGVRVRVHLKLETGNNRQGVDGPACLELAKRIEASEHLILEGLCTHFSDIEDTTDHGFARAQIARFESVVAELSAAKINVRLRHVANTAATLLWSNLPYELVRVGIGAYGLWPSKETRIATLIAEQKVPSLLPALAWKCQISQVKDVEEGQFVGYGRTFRTTHASRIAVLPVGYFDGYDRKASNRGFVLCRGKRAPVVGRVCMNMTMIDVTHIEGVSIGDEIVLMGLQGSECISAEDMAGWTGTINYEVISRIGTHVPRIGLNNVMPQVVEHSPYRLPQQDSID
jgi:alanine racemase